MRRKLVRFGVPICTANCRITCTGFFNGFVLLVSSVIRCPGKIIKDMEKVSRRSNSVLLPFLNLPSSPASLVFQLRPCPRPLLVDIYVMCASLLSTFHHNRVRRAPLFYYARLKLGPMVHILFFYMLLTFLPWMMS